MAGMAHRGVNYWLIDILIGQGVTHNTDIMGDIDKPSKSVSLEGS
jgi:hypothetical protein